MKLSFSRYSTLGFFVVALAAAQTASADLIVDGGFESPVVGPGGYQTGYQAFAVGQTFGGAWTVFGSPTGNVAVDPNSETIGNPPTPLNVYAGSQALDLTGNSDNGAATGVEQTVATTPGTQYTLTYAYGALPNQPVSILVSINGVTVQTASQSPGGSGYVTNWDTDSYTFTALTSSTLLGFLDNSPNGTTLAGLDAVSLNPASSGPATPEPASWCLLAAGGMVLVFLRKKYPVRNR